MQLSVSNLAWHPTEDTAVGEVLRRHGVQAIDVVPTKYFSDVSRAQRAGMTLVKQRWADQGIHIVGFQALLYGTTGLNLFGSSEQQERMLAHLRSVCWVAQGLGARWLTFGSPRNRDRGSLSMPEAETIAAQFFTRLGDIAREHGVEVCLEPNPARYACNFMTDTHETARIVRAVSHPAIRLQLDSGAMTLNGERPEELLSQYWEFVGHVHASEPDLVPVGEGSTDHAQLAEALRRFLPQATVTLEMLTSHAVASAVAVDRALGAVQRHYAPAPRT